MHVRTRFQKTILVENLQTILKINQIHKVVCVSLLYGFCQHYAWAEETTTNTSHANTITNSSNISTTASDTTEDSMQMLQQQQQNQNLTDFKPISFDDLDKMPTSSVDTSMANEIEREAEQAKKEAQATRSTSSTPVISSQPIAQTAQQVNELQQSPINVDALMHQIQTDQNTTVAAETTNKNAENESAFELAHATEQQKPKGFLQKVIAKIKPKKDVNAVTTPKISVTVTDAPKALQDNIKNKLATFTTEAYADYNSALPQLRAMANQAAQAVGYYNAKFKFSKTGTDHLTVQVTPNEPVKVETQNIEFSGAGQNNPQFQVIRLIPDLDVGSIFNHGLYEQTKNRINDAASENGFFDAYWRLHDVKVQLPDNKADINLRYETGERYKVANVEFRMSDPSKPLPLKLKVLQSMVPWKEGDDYAFWRVNTLANNLTNSRYFNWSLVDTIKPNPIVKQLELAPDIQKLVDEQKLQEVEAVQQSQDSTIKRAKYSNKEVTQNVVDENQFAGTGQNASDEVLQSQSQQVQQKSEKEQLQDQARAEKKVPVIVTLNTDKLNSAELGAGWGTDTGPRIRAQYRRGIVNSSGHSFDANMEVSQIRQAIDTRYSIPNKDPLNDYFSLVGGYEREKFKGVGPGMSLTTESAVMGAEHLIKNPLGNWQQIYGFRYRLDQIHQIGQVNSTNVPDAFLQPGSNAQQQALLFGYQISRTDSNNPVNPSKGFKQTYKIQLGSKSVVSDANMAIANADWNFIYSLGQNYDHQFVGGLHLGYIFTDDFANVPYNLRFFAGGDQSVRGFDYKSLSPTKNGYKIGGQALAVGSLEYNYQFKEGWRAAIFSDVGNAYDKSFSNSAAYSVGLGIRWQSPIGPIRLDVASGLSDPNHPIRLHFFIGPQLQ
ncbi:autotransporter assembly complex protein TamA [Acinetobacter sp. ANC 4641]|uniref:autotransporter assembly complex protein TamA n=1 Tax=Acinetobacter sp. ANC 4641 TaxID=2529847 RepID=UPI00103D6680|nr:autotransporter assembly complex family protein [Acinetobacter sp. ANC 4641]TCB12716.1 outer membrane protein assembly factor [Acinetobacter sp. ANC 4641]